jgi:prophage antirepressor-like protein
MNNMNDIHYITVVTEDNTERYIRVFGKSSDPHFCGRDICDIMEFENPKDALQKLVKPDHKKELKNLLKEESNGVIPPSWVGCLKPPTSLGSIDHENISHNDGRLVVLSEPGVEDLLNGSKNHKNKEILKNTISKAVYAIKYENNAGLLDIFSFISKLDLTIDLTSDWFQDLWYPLSTSRHLPGEVPNLVKNRPIIVTENLLNWMGYKGRWGL